MKQTLELPNQLADEKFISGEEFASSEEFSFEIEELDGNRAMMLIVVLDTPTTCPHCHY